MGGGHDQLGGPGLRRRRPVLRAGQICLHQVRRFRGHDGDIEHDLVRVWREPVSDGADDFVHEPELDGQCWRPDSTDPGQRAGYARGTWDGIDLGGQRAIVVDDEYVYPSLLGSSGLIFYVRDLRY